MMLFKLGRRIYCMFWGHHYVMDDSVFDGFHCLNCGKRKPVKHG